MVLEYSDPKCHLNVPYAPPEALEEDVSFWVHLTNTCIHNQARHSDFWFETNFDA